MPFVTYFPGRGSYREEAYLEGKAEGQAGSVLRVLEARAVPVSEAVRERITSCTDPDILKRWLRLAVTAADTEELFREDGEEREV